MSPGASGMLSDAGGVEREVKQKKGPWARMLPALLSTGTWSGGFCCRGGWRQPHVPGLWQHPSSPIPHLPPCAG